MTHKVVIDAFDTQEQAVAFIDWMSSHVHKINLICTTGVHSMEYDGIDIASTDFNKTVVNIVVTDVSDEEDY